MHGKRVYEWKRGSIMSKEIKTRKVQKDIKVLDKVVTSTEHIKRAYVRTKEQAEGTREAAATPVEDAENKIAAGAEQSVSEALHQVREQSGGVWRQRVTRKVSKDTFYQPQAKLRKAGQELAKKKRISAGKLRNSTIKTVETGEKTIKTVGGKQKKTGKGTVKTASRTIKNTEQTIHNTVKTSRAAAVHAKRMAQAAAEAAKQAARTATQTAKVTAKATLAAVRAIIAGTKALVTALLAGGWIAVLILVIVILFGGVLCMVGGGDSNTVSSVSTEVQAYEPLIRQYATQYGIGEYVELIKAIMMQESGGNAIINLSKDLGEIRTTIGKELDMIVSIETNLGDSHNGGKSVLIFVDSNNNKIVYKPRELAPEKLFLHIINWINSTNFIKYELKAPKLLDKKSYGWQEFIEYKSCMSEEEVKAYFYRVGIFLALFYVTRCGDLHYENIIAHGEFPMFVDMETIMSNDIEEKNNYKECHMQDVISAL